MADPLPDSWPERNEWLQVLLSSLGDGIIVTNVQGNVTFLNHVAQSLTGWTQKKAEGAPLEAVFRIVNEDSRQPAQSPTKKAIRDGAIVGLANHTLLIAKDGTERPIDNSAAPLRNDKGEIIGLILIFRDISERRQQERAISDALGYAESIIETMREPFLVVLDKTLKVVTANRCFHEAFKVSKEETESHYLYELGNRQWDIPKLRSLLEELLPQNHSFHDFEVEHDFPQIGRRVMLLNARRVRREALAAKGEKSELILLAIEDITERRQAEARLADSENRYRRLFETARDGILILESGSGKITDANPFMTEILGYSNPELLGKELWQIGLFRDQEANRAVFRQLQDQGYVRYDDLPLETKDGQQVEVEFVSNTYRSDGTVVVQCNIREITERRQLERANVQAEALADLNRRKDEFLAMLSHELRNPLAPIMNAVQLLTLQKGSETSIQQQARTIIERQVGNLKVLVDDLLEVSRISTGTINLNRETLDLRAVVDRAAEAVQGMFIQQQHELSVSKPSEPIWLHADQTRLEQVVGNLLTNAAKYTRKGGRVHLTVRQEAETAVVSVLDTGVGIDPALLPRIFEPFTQAKQSLDRSQGGLGIGLTIVQKLVEMHGGTVDAYSALGRGSEFIVRLPILELPIAQVQSSGGERLSTSPKRVLVVDDNMDTANSLSMILRISGHEVRTAFSGATALEAAEEFRPNVVLLDIGLPEMDGYEVARRLRQNPQLNDVRVVALTGYGQESDRQRTQAAGFDFHLVKPIDAKQLEQVVSSASESRRSGTE